MKIDKKEFKTKDEIFAHLRKNKKTLIEQKKNEIKHSDDFVIAGENKKEVEKELQKKNENSDEIEVTSVMNSCNYMDSHDDVHIAGIWKKTISENKRIFHLQEHTNLFENIIATPQNVEVKTINIQWKKLGYNAENSTQVLVFNSKIKKSVNEKMFDLYQSGVIDQHSVGMQYVNISLAMNSENEEDSAELAVWNKYVERIANKEQAIKQGYFWAVTEAKLLEGSAVMNGSNPITPTLEIKVEPSNIDTQKSNKDTQKVEPSFLKTYLLTN